MKLLLDTQVWLWSLAEPERLNDRAQTLLADLHNQLYLYLQVYGKFLLKQHWGNFLYPNRLLPTLLVG